MSAPRKDVQVGQDVESQELLQGAGKPLTNSSPVPLGDGEEAETFWQWCWAETW